MAVTQASRTPKPMWDEEVVPALRKRLESESRTLAKRISFLDEGYDSAAEHTKMTYAEPRKSNEMRGNSGNGHSRRADDYLPPSAQASSSSSSTARVRTYSQPFSADLPRPKFNGSASQNGIQANGASAARSVSPRQYDVKPSRIPQATTRRRADSISSQPFATSSPPLPSLRPAPADSQDLWVLQENSHMTGSRSSVSVSASQSAHNGILSEQPPFQPGSLSSSHQGSSSNLHEQIDPPRPSIDSEEQPFEHWYRGDVSRNGGVGELKVAKRKEMLDIANYGHKLRERAPQTRNAITEAIDARRDYRRRKRADSIGGLGSKERESFHLDDERVAHATLVVDETPLTDFEAEFSDGGDGSDFYDAYSHSMAATANGSYLDNRSTTPTANYRLDQSSSSRPSSRQQHNTPSRIPTSRQPSDPPRNITPTPMARGGSEPPSNLSASTSSTPRPRQQPQNRVASPSTPAQTKRGASPAPVQSASKKARTAAAQATRAKMEAARKELENQNNNNRNSVAYYPTPDDNMEDAVPVWTQPVNRGDGNWDDVVLPVVARKKGLDGYEQADGSPRPNNEETPIAPAPGTFGWDHSKYRLPQEDTLDEFGRPVQPVQDDSGPMSPPSPQSRHNLPPPISTAHDDLRVGPRPAFADVPNSPSPFAHYQPTDLGTRTQVRAKLELETAPPMSEKDDGAGCCKCVVM